jgi:hypothetical protein
MYMQTEQGQSIMLEFMGVNLYGAVRAWDPPIIRMVGLAIVCAHHTWQSWSKMIAWRIHPNILYQNIYFGNAAVFCYFVNEAAVTLHNFMMEHKG